MTHGRHIVVSVLFLATFIAGCGENPIITAQSFNPDLLDIIGNPNDVIHIQLTREKGVTLDVWGLKSAKPPSEGTVVILHGLGENKSDYLSLGRKFAAEGFDVVLPDLRSHGKSTGKYITCGAKEKQDVKAIVDWMVKHQQFTAKPIYVFGYTFGAATGIQYAAIEPNVAGVLAMAPWKDTAAKAKRDLGPFISDEDLQKKMKQAGNLAGFDPWATSAVRDAATLKCPVYLIHSRTDINVPVEDSQAVFDAVVAPKELRIISVGADHLAIVTDWDNWRVKQLMRLRDNNFGQSPKTPASQPK